MFHSWLDHAPPIVHHLLDFTSQSLAPRMAVPWAWEGPPPSSLPVLERVDATPPWMDSQGWVYPWVNRITSADAAKQEESPHLSILNRRLHDFLTPEELVRRSHTPEDLARFKPRQVGGHPLVEEQENANPNVPGGTPPGGKRPWPTPLPLRTNPTRGTAGVRAKARAVESLFSPSPNPVFLVQDEQGDGEPVVVDSSIDVQEDGNHMDLTWSSSIDQSADLPDVTEEKAVSSPVVEPSNDATDEVERKDVDPSSESKSDSEDVLHPVSRSTAEGHALRQRLRLQSPVYRGCTITTEEVAAALGTLAVGTSPEPIRVGVGRACAHHGVCVSHGWCVCCVVQAQGVPPLFGRVLWPPGGAVTT